MSRGGLLTEELIDMITENDFDSTNDCDYCENVDPGCDDDLFFYRRIQEVKHGMLIGN